MKKVNKIIRKPRIYFYVGFPSLVLWIIIYIWALFEKEDLEYNSPFTPLVLCSPFIIFFLYWCLMSINWRIIIEKDNVTVVNVFRKRKTYKIDDLRLIFKDPNKKGEVKFYLFYGEKKIATVSMFDDNFDLVTKIKCDNSKVL
ncbi:MAG: hypothetical protein K6G28_01340 [Acholeplasmatales bacterium]|nr:hypothetical protein [Acholeplasmatales bacterium]